MWALSEHAQQDNASPCFNVTDIEGSASQFGWHMHILMGASKWQAGQKEHQQCLTCHQQSWHVWCIYHQQEEPSQNSWPTNQQAATTRLRQLGNYSHQSKPHVFIQTVSLVWANSRVNHAILMYTPGETHGNTMKTYAQQSASNF